MPLRIESRKLYEDRIRPLVEREHFGKVVSIDVNSGDYEVARDDADEIPALRRLRARHDDSHVFGLRVGYRTVGRMGGAKRRFTEDEPL